MMLRHLGAVNGADSIENAVKQALEQGYQTRDMTNGIGYEDGKLLGTGAMGKLIFSLL